MNCPGGMRPSQGSVIQFTPDNNWDIIFTKDNKTWIRHLVGWSVTVHVTDYTPDGNGEFDPHGGNIELDVMPTIIPDEQNGTPLTVYSYLTNWGDDLKGTTFEIVPRIGKPQTSWRDRPWEPERP